MNVINIDIDFEKGICEKSGISVVTGDFNSTKLVFNFAQEYEGNKIFELRHINSEIPTYVGEIINNEVVLVGTREEEGQTTIYSLFDQTGDYVFEVSLYQNDSKLTSMFGYITARQEQVVIGDEIVEPYMPIFDTLILEINTKLDEMDSAIQSVANLDIDAEKVEDTTTVTITRQDGSQKSVNIEDGLDGVSLENMEIINKDLYVTYGGNTNDLGQVAPNIQIGTTTTVLPSSSARVINVGTDLNPILNFEIPKGDAGAIKIRIVNELPQSGDEDTFYLVPKQESETQDMYDEYVWINNSWELVGEKQIEVDLSDYYTKSETNTLLSNKVGTTDYAGQDIAGVIKSYDNYGTSVDNGRLRGVTRTYEQYQNANNLMLISKVTLENVITGKGLVSNTDYATSSTGGVIKVQNSYGTTTYNGFLTGNSRSYENYTSDSNALMICKGTLENVISGKNLVSNTDYATESNGGVIKVSSGVKATSVTGGGTLQTVTKTYEQYSSADNSMFIGKGTLENVITGKDLTTKSYVDSLVGDINTALDTINGEVI